MSKFKIKKHVNKWESTKTCDVCGNTDMRFNKSIKTYFCFYRVCKNCLDNYDSIEKEIRLTEKEARSRQLSAKRARRLVKCNLLKKGKKQ